jgi:peptide/nickel transport system permease protein
VIHRGDARRLIANPALLIGVLGLLGLLGMGVFGLMLAPYDPHAGTNLIIRDLPNGNTDIKVPPTLPDPDHWFGTDALGRDQWSRVLAGARLTLTIVLSAAVVRLAIGFSLGLLAGWYGGPTARAVRIIAAGITAIPQLILAIMLVLVLQPTFRERGYIAALALVGWPELVEFLHNEVRRLRVLPYMEAARATGAPPLRLMRTHLLAALAPRLLTLTALETGAVLLLLAELGLVGLFLSGSTELVGESGVFMGTLKERAPEWGQMLGSIQFFAMQFQLSTLIPALFIVVASAIFVLLADGLRLASDPFGERGVLPGTFGALAKSLVGAICFSAFGFFALNTTPTVLTVEEGRQIAATTAERTWPGSQLVAAVVRFSSQSHGLDQPQRLTYYFRNDHNEVLRIAFPNGERLAIEVKQYETEDEIDFVPLKPLPAGLVSWDAPIAQSEQGVGSNFRRANPNYLIRGIVTWPTGRQSATYEVTYGTNNRGQLALRRACCWDALSGAHVEAVSAPRVVLPWPIPPECPVSPTETPVGQGSQPLFVDGTNGLALATYQNLYYQGDNYLVLLAEPAGVRLPTLGHARHATDATAVASVMDGEMRGTSPSGRTQLFATLRLSRSGCWNMRIEAGTNFLEYTIYVYPWQCRPSRDQIFPPPAGIVAERCAVP